MKTRSDATSIRRKCQRWERSAQVLIAETICAKPHDVQFSFSINQRPVRARARSTRKKQFLINNNRFHDGETVMSHYRFLRSRSPLVQGLRALAFFRPASSERYRALLAARKSDSIGSIAHYGSKHLSVKWVVAQLKDEAPRRPRRGARADDN